MSSIPRNPRTEATQRARETACVERVGIGETMAVRHSRSRRGFSSMEVMVGVAIVLVLVVIAVPIFRTLREKKNKGITLATMRQLSGAMKSYAEQNGGLLPAEDHKGRETWPSMAQPEAKEVWYNALPRVLGRKPAADFSASPSSFYSAENVLFLAGA